MTLRAMVLVTVCLSLTGATTQAQRSGPVEVPFESDFGLVWVQVTVNGSLPRWFILDTGFEFSLVNATTAARLGLRVEDPQMVSQPGGVVEMGAVPDVSLRIGPLPVPPFTAQAVPLSAMEPMVGRSLDGVLGHDVITQFVLTIDYDRRMLVFRPASGALPLPDGAVLPLTIVANEPFVDAVIRQPHASEIGGRFKLDTGSLDALGLNRNYFEAQHVLAPGQAAVRIPGAAMGGETDGMLFRVEEFDLGPYAVRRPVIGVTLASAGFENRADAGTIGAEVLRRFTVTLDYAHSRMVIAPNSQFDEAPTTDRSGMWVMAEGPAFNDFRVHFVLPGGPAEDAGVQAEDRILTVNGRPANGLRLVDLWQTWRQPDGTPVGLELRRGKRRLTVRLILRSPV